MKKTQTKILFLLLATLLGSVTKALAQTEIASIDATTFTGMTANSSKQIAVGESYEAIFYTDVAAGNKKGGTCYPSNVSVLTLGSSGNKCYYEIVDKSNAVYITKLEVLAISNGTTQRRVTLQFAGADGVYGTSDSQPIFGGPNSSTAACITSVFEAEIPAGTKHIKITQYGSNSPLGGKDESTNIFSIKVYANTGPSVALTSGQAAATGMATLAIDPIVYTYSNVDDATLAWQSDAPSGISVVKDTEAKTLTISGTPTTAGVYGYTVSVADGNTLTGSLSVSAYATPTPEITTPANSSQSKKAGAAIEDIIYHFKHTTGATAAGLPGGLTGVYADSKMTISGTLLAESSYPATYSYTVSATPLGGYTGDVVSATGVITVKDPSAKSVLYLAGGGTAQKSPDLLLDQMNSKYDVTLRAAQANFTGSYNDYDLIVLHESLTGNDAQTAAHELAQMKGVDKPILNTKSYFYTSARWNWGAASNGNSQSFVTMSAISPRHPIFEDIADTEGAITLLSVDMAKNIQPITSFTSDGYKGYELATVPGGVAIHEIPAQGRGAGITAKYLMVSLLNDAFANLTTDGLKLLDNACAYLLSSAVYTPITVSVDQIVSSALYFDGQMLHNPSSVSIELIDMAGRSLVRTSTSVSLEQLNRGFYLVRELESGLQMKIVR